MNCNILIISLVALCCLQLVVAREEGEPVLRRSRSRRVGRSRTKKIASPEVDSSTDTSNTKTSDSNIFDNIPTRANKSVLIEGRDGANSGIFVDGKKLYSFDNNRLNIKIRDGNFYVNDKLVLKKAPAKYGVFLYSMHTLNYQGVARFTLKLDPEGFMHYTDSRGENFKVNYFSPVFFG